MNIFYRFGFLIITFLFLLFPNQHNAQGKGTLRGQVVDASSGEALLFANVLIKELELGTSTNDQGYFIFTSVHASKKYILLASYVGYEEKEIDVVVQPGKVTQVIIELTPSSFELQTVEKVGKRQIETNATDVGLRVITIKELESIPQGVELDLFRSLQY
ncbi:MAG: carboxypeptidase-like regulatory domain-containing protein, partial [Melioribacteraceae bacterium]|nr:carboxypeptidase-like regulatory domain-containing protein [Melioribacteraceae bacterium]